MSDIANTPATTATLAPGGEVASTIDAPGDQDWFRADLLGGFNYDIRMRGDGSLDAIPQVEFFVFDENSEQIFNVDRGNASSVSGVFTAPRDGTYFIAAAGDDGQEQGNYVIQLLDDEASSATNTPATIDPGGTVAGLINGEGDSDWYRVELLGGFDYDIRLGGDGTLDALPQVEFSVFDENGERLFNVDRGNAPSVSGVFTAPRDGTYFVAAQGDDGQAFGSYELELLDDEASSATNTPATISPGETVAGLINGEGDSDWYRVELLGGFDYDIRLGGDGTLDAVPQVEFSVFDENGERLFNVDRGNVPSVSGVFTAPRDGIYFVAAQGDDGQAFGSYELSLGIDEAASATVTPLVLRPGQTVEGEIGGFGDRDWYRTALIEGQQYAIEMTGDGSADSIGQVEIAIYDDVAVFLGGREDGSPAGAETFLFTAPETGTYYIAALGEDDNFTGRYRLSLSGDDGRGIGLSTAEAETVALLYEAGLNRPADVSGVNFWIDGREGGLAELDLAAAFLDSDEFQASAEAFLADGTDLTDDTVRDPEAFADADYVTLLYENVLDRPADQGGFEFWLSVLGIFQETPAQAPTARERLLLAFSESDENRDGSPTVEALTEVTPGEWDFLTA